MGKFLKPLATINLTKNPTFVGNFCKGVKIYHFWDILRFVSGHTAHKPTSKVHKIMLNTFAKTMRKSTLKKFNTLQIIGKKLYNCSMKHFNVSNGYIICEPKFDHKLPQELGKLCHLQQLVFINKTKNCFAQWTQACLQRSFYLSAFGFKVTLGSQPYSTSMTRLGDFWKFLVNKFLVCLFTVWAVLKHPTSWINCCSYFLGNF